MYIIIERMFIFRALQHVLAFVGTKRPTVQILGHILLQVRNNNLFIVGSDIDMEIIVNLPIYKIYEIGQVTASARKFYDICRTLSEQSKITLQHQEDKLLISSENTHFSLSTFSPLDFPNINFCTSDLEFIIPSIVLKKLIESTQFAMGRHDVRYCLNGMLFEFDTKKFRAVATDGHRLALCVTSIILTEVKLESSYSIIVPRKYIISMIRMLNLQEKNIKLRIGTKNISMTVGNYVLTSKLINGNFPNYQSIFLQESSATLEVESKKLQKAIKRAIIVSNEKFHIVRFLLTTNRLKVISSNSQSERSEQILDVIYLGRDMEIGFNVYYVLDVLNIIKSKKVRFLLKDENSSVQIVSSPMDISSYVIMPIRL